MDYKKASYVMVYVCTGAAILSVLLGTMALVHGDGTLAAINGTCAIGMAVCAKVNYWNYHRF